MGYQFYGWDHGDVREITDEYRRSWTPCELYDALMEIWCEYTCAPRLRGQWSEENRTVGQCSITAFLAQDIFGGKVCGILRPGGNYHCYNVVGDCVFDLTSEQFGDEALDYENNPEQFREVHFAKEEKRQRYEFLKGELERRFGRFQYRRATIRDLDLLAETRIEVLRAANKLSDDTDMSEVKRQSCDYYERALCDGTHIAYLVFDGNCVIGTGGVSFFRVMPTFHNPSGKKAYIMNMYTKPEYRRKGIAYRTLDLLVKDSKREGVTDISLEATPMGRCLYEKYGFVSRNDEMELPGAGGGPVGNERLTD